MSQGRAAIVPGEIERGQLSGDGALHEIQQGLYGVGLAQ